MIIGGGDTLLLDTLTYRILLYSLFIDFSDSQALTIIKKMGHP